MTEGSSPRMRGTHLEALHPDTAVGIIPAYAGNTSAAYPPHRNTRDHPRVCGEHAEIIGETCTIQGSSPRMRGTRISSESVKDILGIIPAYAGNTALPVYPPPAARDHPRVCGEHFRLLARVLSCLGSSPRMRGTQHVSVHIARRMGIIPAYAGNTMLGSW